MTPSFSGRMAWMWLGVRPIIRLASVPTANGRPSLTLTATTEGSFRTIPRPRTYTRVLAVPRSTAISRPNREKPLSRIRDATLHGGLVERACLDGIAPAFRWILSAVYAALTFHATRLVTGGATAPAPGPVSYTHLR